jgi:hypothetical protein
VGAAGVGVPAGTSLGSRAGVRAAVVAAVFGSVWVIVGSPRGLSAGGGGKFFERLEGGQQLLGPGPVVLWS